MKLRVLFLFSFLSILNIFNPAMISSNDKKINSEDRSNCINTVYSFLKEIPLMIDTDMDSVVYIIDNLKKMGNETDDVFCKSVINFYTAQSLLSYYNSNQYIINSRTNVLGDAPEDIREWTQNVFQKNILDYISMAVSDKEELQKHDISEIKALLEEDDDFENSNYYSFILNEAISLVIELNFTSSDSENDNDMLFYKNATLPYTQFIAADFNVCKNKNLSFIAKAYQSLLKYFHDNKLNVKYLGADIDRLEFFNKDNLYDDVVIEQFKNYADFVNDESALLAATEYTKMTYQKIRSEYGDWDNDAFNKIENDDYSSFLNMPCIKEKREKEFQEIKKLLDFSDNLISKFKDSEYVGLLKTVRGSIKSGSYSFSISSPYLYNKANCGLLKYRNMEEVLLSITDENSKEIVWEKQVNTPVRPALIDEFMKIDLPKLTFGKYLLETDKSERSFCVTNLQGFNRAEGKMYKFYVVNKTTGFPEKDVTINFYSNNDRKRSKPLTHVLTDNNGFAEIPISELPRTAYYTLNKNKDIYSQLEYIYDNNYRSSSKRKEISIYTDRSVYRPGQKLYFKAIIWDDNKVDNRVLGNEKIKVTLDDTNGKEIQTQRLTSDSFGAVAGEFVIPTGIKNGTLCLRANNNHVFIEVAEYKRPSFEITFDEVSDAYKYGDSILVSGNVKTFSGFDIENCNVEYSVSQNPTLLKSHMSYNIITTGAVKTKANGTFELKFLAEEPHTDYSFLDFTNFEVSVKVTSPSGETQNEKFYVRVGKSSIVLQIDAYNNYGVDANVKSKQGIVYINKAVTDSIEIISKNLNGKLYNGKATLYLYRTDVSRINSQCEELENEDNLIKSIEFDSNKKSFIDYSSIDNGFYVLKVVMKDNYGNESEKSLLVFLFSPGKKMVLNSPDWAYLPKNKLKVGEKQEIEVGTSMKNVYVYYFVNYKDGSEYENFVLNNERKSVPFEYKAKYGNVCSINILFVKEGNIYYRRYLISKVSDVDNIKVEVLSFRDKIQAGGEETWSIVIKDKNNKGVSAQLLADMYDASLDKIKNFRWNMPFQNGGTYIPNEIRWPYSYNIYINNSYPSQYFKEPSVYIPVFNDFGLNDNMHYRPMIRSSFGLTKAKLENDIVVSFGVREDSPKQYLVGALSSPKKSASADSNKKMLEEEAQAAEIDELDSENQFRQNFNETAFFYPILNTNENGEVKFTFTAPEALTQWRFMALATTQDKKYGFIEKYVTTTKDFMVSPNLPRFVRNGDKAMISFMVLNNTNNEQSGTGYIEMFIPENDSVWYSNQSDFSVEKGKSAVVTFEVDIPQDISLTGIRLRASNGTVSDGEQHLLAILPSRTLVTQSMNMNVTSKGNNKFTFKDFINNKSKTLTNLRYTVEFTGNPSWYAVNALAAQRGEINKNIVTDAVSRFFVNTLSCYIAKSNPEIKKYVDKLDKNDVNSVGSELEKNPELKEMLLSQTPWVLDAENERNNILSLASLFDENRNRNIQSESLELVRSLQNEDGGFCWYKGLNSNLFETLNVLNALARLKELGALESNEAIEMISIKAVNYSDKNVEQYHTECLKFGTELDYVPRYSDLLWAMIRSYYRDIPFNYGSSYVHKRILNYMKDNWKNFQLYEKTVSSIALNKFGFKEDADAISKYILRTSTYSLEMGRYWANNKTSYFNGVSSLLTHVMAMQALALDGDNVKLINELKTWLLRQKQVQQWENLPATVDAVYAILNNGSDWLSSKDLPIVKVGNVTVEAKGFVAMADTAFNRNEIKKEYGNISVTRDSDSPAFGAAYWQYFEDFSKIKQNFTGLKIKKELYKEVKRKDGVALVPIDGTVGLGDIVVTRITVTSDRDYEYVVLKDQRAACFEPFDQLSGYRYKQGVGYFFETKDATTNFFFSLMPKGTFVFEYKVKAVIKGQFNDGISTIQCYYAPQFVGNTHGDSVGVK